MAARLWPRGTSSDCGMCRRGRAQLSDCVQHRPEHQRCHNRQPYRQEYARVVGRSHERAGQGHLPRRPAESAGVDEYPQLRYDTTVPRVRAGQDGGRALRRRHRQERTHRPGCGTGVHGRGILRSSVAGAEQGRPGRNTNLRVVSKAREEKVMAQPIIADLVIRNIGELLTMKGVDDPVVAPAAGDLGIIRRGEVAVKDRKILYVGPKDGGSYIVGLQTMIIDAENKVVCPGFVDSHTHAIFAGTREDEFLMRLQGKSCAEIQAAGGGIVKTVRATRMASEEKLRDAVKRSIFKLSRYGSTTAEIKRGYGLNTEEEIKLLRVIKEVAIEPDFLIIPPLLVAHVFPPEYVVRRHKYVELVARHMVPMVHENHLAIFVDVYVDESAFTIEEARVILTAAHDHDMPRKLHADEMADGHGAELAAEMGCVSADHLVWTSEKGMKAMAKEGVVATLMPGTCLLYTSDAA